MFLFILVFGALTFWAGLAIARNPATPCGYLRKHESGVVLYIANVVVRIIFGLLLLTHSNISKFPLITDIIGWFCIGIALILTFIGRERFKRGISWAIALIETNSRVAGTLIMLFGTFLMYSFS